MYQKLFPVILCLSVGTTLLGEDKGLIDELFTAYLAGTEQSPPGRDQAELADWFSLTDGKMLIDATLNSGQDHYALWWSAPDAALHLIQNGVAIKDLVVINGSKPLFSFAAVFKKGLPQVTGWADLFEGAILLQFEAKGESVRSAIYWLPVTSGTDGEEGEQMAVAQQQTCQCIGAVANCCDLECNFESPCGNMSNGVCHWINPPPAPAPQPPAPPPAPPQPSRCPGGAGGGLPFTLSCTLLGLGGMKASWRSHLRFRR